MRSRSTRRNWRSPPPRTTAATRNARSRRASWRRRARAPTSCCAARTGRSACASQAAALPPVRAAMQAHPRLVSGPARFDHDLAGAFGARMVSKGGAEALQAIGFSDPPLGIAVKVLDGGERALAPICLAVLAAL